MMPPNSSKSQKQVFLSADQVAERWGISVRQVRRYIDSAELPTHRFGKLVRISLKDLLLFEANKSSMT